MGTLEKETGPTVPVVSEPPEEYVRLTQVAKDQHTSPKRARDKAKNGEITGAVVTGTGRWYVPPDTEIPRKRAAITPDIEIAAIRLVDAGWTYEAVGRSLGKISPASVHRIVSRRGKVLKEAEERERERRQNQVPGKLPTRRVSTQYPPGTPNDQIEVEFDDLPVVYHAAEDGSRSED